MQLLRSWLDAFGFQIYKFAMRATSRRSLVTPLATYCPWDADAEFQRAYAQVRHNTLVDMYRQYDLWHLVGQVTALEGAILEVGVWRGGTGCLLGARAQSLGITAPVFLCDTFSGVVKAGADDNSYRGGEHAVGEEPARSLAERMQLRQVQLLRGIFPDDTAERLGDTRIRFCHIDVDVYQSARDVFEWVWPRLEVGGIVVYDDYGFAQTAGVARHVNEMTGQSDRRVVYNLNGHAVVIRTA